jgi:hypothetical protein
MQINKSSDESGSKPSTNDNNNEDFWNEIDIETGSWEKEHELILANIADQALCYYWLHLKSTKLYEKYDLFFTLPVIFISTLTYNRKLAPQTLQGQI